MVGMEGELRARLPVSPIARFNTVGLHNEAEHKLKMSPTAPFAGVVVDHQSVTGTFRKPTGLVTTAVLPLLICSDTFPDVTGGSRVQPGDPGAERIFLNYAG